MLADDSNCAPECAPEGCSWIHGFNVYKCIVCERTVHNVNTNEYDLLSLFELWNECENGAFPPF